MKKSFFSKQIFLLQSRPGFEDFRSASPSFSGFPSDHPGMDSRKFSSPQPSTSNPSTQHQQQRDPESIPIRVIHEPRNSSTDKHRYGGTAKTTDIPTRNVTRQDPSNSSSAGSPRVARAHSEPPKTFNQRPTGMKTRVPLGNLPEQMEQHCNLSTSASDPSVPAQSNSSHHPDPGPPQNASATAAPPPGANVRHIPIFVEGRDKPVMNKDTSTTSTASTEPPIPPPKRPTDFAKKVNLTPNPKLEEPTSPLSPIPSDQPIPMGYTETTSNANKAPSTTNGAESESSIPSGPIPMPCGPEHLAKPASSQSEDKIDSAKKPAAEQEQPSKPDPCREKLAKIQADVKRLSEQLEKFKGSKDSKEYKYLDEMLTRNLLALDGLNLEGRDDVRQDRKQSIKDINRFLSILESKASGNDQQAAINNEILSDLASNQQK